MCHALSFPPLLIHRQCSCLVKIYPVWNLSPVSKRKKGRTSTLQSALNTWGACSYRKIISDRVRWSDWLVSNGSTSMSSVLILLSRCNFFYSIYTVTLCVVEHPQNKLGRVLTYGTALLNSHFLTLSLSRYRESTKPKNSCFEVPRLETPSKNCSAHQQNYRSKL